MALISRRRLIAFTALIGGGLAAGAALTGCSTLKAFNSLTPKDGGSKRVAQNVAYGPEARHRYDVYAPTKVTGPLPVIVFFYGGGWNSGSKDDYSWAGRALAALGYVVVLPDYRLVPQVRFPDFLEDCALAVKHVAAHIADRGGDASRLCLMGHSAGAYNAAMLTLDGHYLAALPVKAMVGLSGPYDFLPFDVKESIDAFSAWPRPHETQPLHFAHKTDTKFLLFHSRTDKVVMLKNSVNLSNALKTAGTSCELVIFDKLDHPDTAAALSIPFRGKAPVLANIRDFLATTLISL
jgi:acetyl esterase/lipase